MPRVASDCAVWLCRHIPHPSRFVASELRISIACQKPPECLLINGSKVHLAPLIAAHIAPGDASKYVMEGWKTGGDNRCFLTAIRLLSNGKEPVNPEKNEKRFCGFLSRH